MWLWWRVENWLNTVYKPILLEIKIPKDSLKPIRAMESVISSIHQVSFQPPDWWEKWIEGQVQTTVFLEIAGTGGEIHFYIRAHADYRQALESAIYAQYPEAEITLAQDYTKTVPPDIPNKDWDLFGSDFRLIKDDHYPIKTYPQFETETESEEEKRIDPVASLLEAMAKLKQDEHLWIQMGIEPFSADPTMPFEEWLKMGDQLRDKLAKRPEKPERKSMVREGTDLLLFGTPPGQAEKEQEDVVPLEYRLTPGERSIVEAIELKMSKPVFRTSARFIYFGRTDIWFKPNFRLAFSFFSQYTTNHMNSIQPSGVTLTKIHKSWFLPLNWFRPRRAFLRRRKLFRNYVNRYSPLYPRPSGDLKAPPKKKLTFVINTEEVASIFHFPSWAVSPVPGVPRVEAKKGAPPNLPTD